MAAVRDGGFGSLNPCATVVESGSRAVVVECIDLKPCLFRVSNEYNIFFKLKYLNFSVLWD